MVHILAKNKAYTTSLQPSFPIPTSCVHDPAYVIKEYQRHTIQTILLTWLIKLKSKKCISQFA